ncbi:MAG: hypothetical protein JW995_15205 [Melioribacteraceae bacterium]|nr:hypothetical protein [Melioribacteraceae bacterium]
MINNWKIITSDIISSSGTFAGTAEVSLINVESFDEPFFYDIKNTMSL